MKKKIALPVLCVLLVSTIASVAIANPLAPVKEHAWSKPVGSLSARLVVTRTNIRESESFRLTVELKNTGVLPLAVQAHNPHFLTLKILDSAGKSVRPSASRMSEESVAASLVFGSAIHSAAEFHFNELMAGNPKPDLDTLLYVYQESWQSRDGENINFGKTNDVDSLGQLAERMLVALLESDFAIPSGHIIGVEEELRGNVLPGCPELLARLDLITETDDDVVITDLKTARSRWSQQKVEDSADQLLLYSELVREFVPGKPLKLQFVVVTKSKQPVVDHHVVPIDPRRIARIKKVAQRVWQAVQAGHCFPSPSAMNCPSCGYRTACKSWAG